MRLIGDSHYGIGAIDVKVAFLQAPRRTQMTRVTLGEPPSLLKAMNMVKPETNRVARRFSGQPTCWTRVQLVHQRVRNGIVVVYVDDVEPLLEDGTKDNNLGSEGITTTTASTTKWRERLQRCSTTRSQGFEHNHVLW
jgi:hypothetical protein